MQYCQIVGASADDASDYTAAMQRAYYVVNDDSDRDDDVINSCHSQTGDVTENCSPGKTGGTVSFRLLRAYRTKKRRRRRAAERHENSTMPTPTSAMMTSSLGTAIANSRIVGPPEVADKAEMENCVVTFEGGGGPLSRKQVCASFCKRFVAFLLSTFGLSITTVVYSLLGGLLFAAIEAPHELRVKIGVHDSIDWHVTALWQLTSQLNVLHPVTHTAFSRRVLAAWLSG